MGRKPKIGQKLIPYVLDSAIRTVAGCRFPSSPDLLRRIIDALIKKTLDAEASRNRAREQSRIRTLLQMLVAIEQIQAKTPWPDGSALYLVPTDEFVNEIPKHTLNAYSSFLLNELSLPNRSRRQHLLVTLRLQRDFILDFMDHHSYQNLADRPQEEWFEKKHGDHLFSVLRAYPCFCSYPETLKEILYPPGRDCPLSELDNRKGKYLAPAGSTINYLLGNLHRTTPQQIQKLLKEPLREGLPRVIT